MTNSIHFAIQSHPFANLLIATDGQGVCAVLLGDSPEELRADLQKRFPKQQLLESNKPEIQAAMEQVILFLNRPDHVLAVNLHLTGTDFQLKVWSVLQQCLPGTTLSYSDIAKRIGQPTAARAVARACASNPVALAVPCHRVVRSDGGLSGYRWGIERKRKLLAMEKECVNS